MLRALAIRDLAIIRSLSVEFAPGLTVLTGETGAGKSIIIGALEAVLGDRVGADLVRAGAARAVVDAIFDLSGAPDVAALIEDMGYDVQGGEIALTREISDSGKSVARISGRPATAGQLRQIGEWLVDIHGQHEHQSLLDPRRHMAFMDSWAGPNHAALQERTAVAWKRWRELEAELASFETDARERLRLIDLYRFQVEEISRAAPTCAEDERLEDELRRLRNVERLREAVVSALTALDETGRGSVTGILAAAARELEGASQMDPALAEYAETISSVRYEIEEAIRSLTDYADSLDADPYRLDAVQERLATLTDLKRKYGATIEEVLAYRDDTARKLETLEHGEAHAEHLQVRVAEAGAEYQRASEALTASRLAAARRFREAVMSELRQLAMERADFSVRIEPTAPSVSGSDALEFMLASNPGEPLRPLAKIASGGEISRLMLAIKSALASRSPLPTLVFDEVDVGIGGRTASVIGDKMRALATSAQVLCITHLPQIAACAHTHYGIRKVEEEGRAVVRIEPLDHDARIEELARMLAGSNVTQAARDHVRTMLAQFSK